MHNVVSVAVLIRIFRDKDKPATYSVIERKPQSRQILDRASGWSVSALSHATVEVASDFMIG
jgi:uncharacterized membrane protein YwaF